MDSMTKKDRPDFTRCSMCPRNAGMLPALNSCLISNDGDDDGEKVFKCIER